jgi:hypothetical protein
MSFSKMVEMPRVHGKKRSVMPAAGQHPGVVMSGNTQSLDSGFRRNDEKETVNFESTPTRSLGFGPRIPESEQNLIDKRRKGS